MSNISLSLCTCVTLVSLCYANLYYLQAVCEEIRRLAPKAGLHHDGVVFGSDDFCASIGSYYTFCLTGSHFVGQKCVILSCLSMKASICMRHSDKRRERYLHIVYQCNCCPGFCHSFVSDPFIHLFITFTIPPPMYLLLYLPTSL